MFKWIKKIFNHGHDGSLIVGDEHVIEVTPFDAYYIKVGSQKAKEWFPEYYRSKN